MDDSDQYRHECECRHWNSVIRKIKYERGRTAAETWTKGFFADIAKKRGRSAAKRLRDGMRAAWMD